MEFVYPALVMCNNQLVYLLFPAAFLTQTVMLDDITVKFEIWDTAGQERYHSLAPMYYRGAQAAIVVYDITNQVENYLILKILQTACIIGRGVYIFIDGYFFVQFD